MADADAENGMTDPETSSPRTAPATYMLSQSKPVPEAAPSKYVHCVMLVPEDEMKGDKLLQLPDKFQLNVVCSEAG